MVDSKLGNKIQDRIHRRGTDMYEYKMIEDEMNRSSQWPPMSTHTASLADLMRLESEISMVTEGGDETAASDELTDLDASFNGKGRSGRHRQISESSFDNVGFYSNDKEPMITRGSSSQGDIHRSPASSPTKADAPLLPSGAHGDAAIGFVPPPPRAGAYVVARSESKEDAPLVAAEVDVPNSSGDMNMRTQTTFL